MLNEISYRIQFGIISTIARLPLWILYLASDVLFFLNYYLIRYRYAVVVENLRKSFPNRDEAEVKRITKAFYHYLSDQLVETFKTLVITEEELDRRVVVLNPEVMDTLYEQGRSVVHLLGHHANWEWYAKQLHRKTKHQLFFVYKPLSNKGMDKVMFKLRSRFGVMPVAMKDVFRTIESWKVEPHASFFGGDQSPMRHNKYIWTTFLHQETAVYTGAEDIAKKYDEAVVFGKMRRIKRGYYTIELALITDSPKQTEPAEITKAHTKVLEDFLEEQPEYWLWSHKRWKLSRVEAEA